MKKPILYVFLTFLLLSTSRNYSQCDASQQCTYTFNMTDNWGDGWNENTISVIQNGQEIAVIGADFTTGNTFTQSVELCDGVPFELYWSAGNFPGEIGFTLENSFGQTIFSIPNGTAAPGTTILSGIANCMTPVCLNPTSVVASNVNATQATITWPNTGTNYEILILPAEDLPPTVTDSGISVNTNLYLATGLTPNLFYVAYVRSICDEGEVQPWTASAPFLLSCDYPFNVSSSNISLTSAEFSWNDNGIATQWEVLILPSSEPYPEMTATGIVVDEAVFVADGLQSGTPYKAYIRALCGDVPSIWTAHSFVTQHISMSPLITNTTQYSMEQLVNSVMVNNPCIEITNVTSSINLPGAQTGIGYFVNTNSTFPLSSGLVLSTGNVNNIPGPNTSTLSDGNTVQWPGDPELEAIIGAATGTPMDSYNASRLEFDFISSNEFMSFNFLFASDEYGIYQCDYADSFAFLLTDLTTGITTNIAVVPGTTIPVSVVTIRDAAYNSNCVSMNPGFFNAYNSGSNIYTSATNFNGQTAVMTASSAIIPGNPYHIKLVIADRGDAAYDSAVFIEAGSFTAGPPECSDKIQLIAFVDENANGIKDAGENNFTYGSFVYQQNNAGDVHNINSPFGTHTIYDSVSGNLYDFSYDIDAEYLPYYSDGNLNYDDISIVTGSGTQILYFPIALTQDYNDVSVAVIPVTPPVPGFTYYNKVQYTNLGVAAASGTITFTNDPLTQIISVQPGGTVVTPTGFTYNFTNLQPYETRSFLVTLSVPAIPAANIDDLLTSSASITAVANDITATNNEFENTQIVVGSYDPNDIHEKHGPEIPINTFSANDHLVYTIRFQNTGTANAINIEIENILDSQLDPESVRMISASHDYVLERVNNKLTWRLNFIHLVPQLQDELLSQGYVTFMVKVNPGFAVGDMIPSSAEIFFDTNPGIITNTFTTLFTTALSNNEFTSKTLSLYPNPANHTVKIDMKNSDSMLDQVALYDVLGKQVIKLSSIASAQTAINVSDLSNGIYIVEITTSDNQKHVKKLVIE